MTGCPVLYHCDTDGRVEAKGLGQMDADYDVTALGVAPLVEWRPAAAVTTNEAAPVAQSQDRVVSIAFKRPDPVIDEAVELMSIHCLEERCAEETQRYYHSGIHDSRYGYQLFRLAIVERDHQAWAAIERLYRRQLMRWARGHRLYDQISEEAEALANRALENLWRRVGPTSFDDFNNLSSILGYLQRCVYNLVIDHARSQARERQRTQALAQEQAMAWPIHPTPQVRALDQVRAGEIWSTVRSLCRNDREVLAAYCYLVLNLKPSDIMACYPVEFGSTAAIHTLLATLLKRLRRSPLLRRECEETLLGRARA